LQTKKTVIHHNLEIMYHSAGLGHRLRASGWRSTLLLP